MLISSLMLHCWHCSKWKADSEIVHYDINQSLKMVCVPRCCDIHPARAVRGVHSPVNTHCPLSHDGVIPLWKEEVMKLCVSGFWLITVTLLASYWSHWPCLWLVTLTLLASDWSHWPGTVLEGPDVPHDRRWALDDVRSLPGVSVLPWQSSLEAVNIQPHIVINLDNEPGPSAISKQEESVFVWY